MKKITYDRHNYDFVREIQKLYLVSDLSEIHNQWDKAHLYEEVTGPGEDQQTVYHKRFYEGAKSNTNFYTVYNSFLRNIISPIFDDNILFQKIPTFRVQPPDHIAVTAYHKDKDYSHSEHEVNFYLPLTKAWETNTIWVETDINSKVFCPIEANVGEVIMWDGANLLHGNKKNDTGKTRISIDFRVLLVSEFCENDDISIANKTPMNIGGYWEIL